MTNFAARLRWARKRRGMTQPELSRTAGLARDHVRSLEAKRYDNPTEKTRTKLAEALGFAGSSRIWFVYGIGEKPEARAS